MIDLKKDFFVHMSLSAKALKEQNSKEKVVQRTALSNLEKTSYDSVTPIKNIKSIKVSTPKSMEETIADVVDNPKIKELKKELAAVEEIFESLKDSGENLDFIYRIENKIEQLRKMIDQKSYL